MKKIMILLILAIAFYGCFKNNNTEVKPELKVSSCYLEKKLIKAIITGDYISYIKIMRDASHNIFVWKSIKNTLKIKNESSKVLKITKISLMEVKCLEKTKEYEAYFDVFDEEGIECLNPIINTGSEEEFITVAQIDKYLIIYSLNQAEEVKKYEKEVEDMKGIKIRIVYEIEGQEKSQEEYLSF